MDTCIFLRAYEQPDPTKSNYEELRKQMVEAQQAIRKLHENGEKLYRTPEILQEVKDVAQRSQNDNGLNLTAKQADQLVNYIRSHFEECPKDQRKEDEKRKEATTNLKDAEARAHTPDEKKSIREAYHDVPHVAQAMAHDLTVVTFNTKHFRLFEDIAVRHPRDLVLDLKPEQVKSVKAIPNLHPGQHEYKNTVTYEVEAASGKVAPLNVRGRHTQNEVKHYVAPSAEVLERIETWNSQAEPIKVKIGEDRPNTPPPRGGGSPAGGGPSGTSESITEQQEKATARDTSTLMKVLVEVEQDASGKVQRTVAALEDGQTFKRLPPNQEWTVRTHAGMGREVCFTSATIEHKEMLDLIKGDRQLLSDIAEVERGKPRTAELKPLHTEDKQRSQVQPQQVIEKPKQPEPPAPVPPAHDPSRDRNR